MKAIGTALLRGAALVFAASLGLALLWPGSSVGYSLGGGSLAQDQRDFRVFNNFTDLAANDNQTPDPLFAGYQGAVMAIWKATVEWGSALHGDGSGDPHQPFDLGSGGANFDSSFQGEATGIGGTNDNVHSELPGSAGGVLAFTEAPISDGWRVRYYSAWNWLDGPEATTAGGVDLQSVATHEVGHTLGLGHSSVSTATMAAGLLTGVDARSLDPDDSAGVQAIYGVKATDKPEILGYSRKAASITVMGTGFDPSGNQLWFTQLSAGGNGDPIKLKGLTSNGFELTATLPAKAGSGDLLVRRNSSAYAGLSNAFPFDANSSGYGCGVEAYGLGLGGVNIGGLDASGAASLGATLELSATGLTGNSTGKAIFSLTQTATPLLGGTILVDLVNPAASVSFTTTAGTGTFFVLLPSSPSLAGLVVFVQAGALDMAMPFGWALTSGLKLTLCP